MTRRIIFSLILLFQFFTSFSQNSYFLRLDSSTTLASKFVIISVTDNRFDTDNIGTITLGGDSIALCFDQSLEEELFVFYNQTMNRDNHQMPIELVIQEFDISKGKKKSETYSQVVITFDYYLDNQLFYANTITHKKKGKVTEELILQNIYEALSLSLLDFNEHNPTTIIDDSAYEERVELRETPPPTDKGSVILSGFLGTMLVILLYPYREE